MEKAKKPIRFENRLKFHPKIFVEYSTPRRVGYSLPKIRKIANSIKGDLHL
jgi:hypothetical protein